MITPAMSILKLRADFIEHAAYLRTVLKDDLYAYESLVNAIDSGEITAIARALVSCLTVVKTNIAKKCGSDSTYSSSPIALIPYTLEYLRSPDQQVAWLSLLKSLKSLHDLALYLFAPIQDSQEAIEAPEFDTGSLIKTDFVSTDNLSNWNPNSNLRIGIINDLTYNRLTDVLNLLATLSTDAQTALVTLLNNISDVKLARIMQNKVAALARRTKLDYINTIFDDAHNPDYLDPLYNRREYTASLLLSTLVFNHRESLDLLTEWTSRYIMKEYHFLTPSRNLLLAYMLDDVDHEAGDIGDLDAVGEELLKHLDTIMTDEQKSKLHKLNLLFKLQQQQHLQRTNQSKGKVEAAPTQTDVPANPVEDFTLTADEMIAGVAACNEAEATYVLTHIQSLSLHKDKQHAPLIEAIIARYKILQPRLVGAVTTATSDNSKIIDFLMLRYVSLAVNSKTILAKEDKKTASTNYFNNLLRLERFYHEFKLFDEQHHILEEELFQELFTRVLHIFTQLSDTELEVGHNEDTTAFNIGLQALKKFSQHIGYQQANTLHGLHKNLIRKNFIAFSEKDITAIINIFHQAQTNEAKKSLAGYAEFWNDLNSLLRGKMTKDAIGKFVAKCQNELDNKDGIINHDGYMAILLHVSIRLNYKLNVKRISHMYKHNPEIATRVMQFHLENFDYEQALLMASTHRLMMTANTPETASNQITSTASSMAEEAVTATSDFATIEQHLAFQDSLQELANAVTNEADNLAEIMTKISQGIPAELETWVTAGLKTPTDFETQYDAISTSTNQQQRINALLIALIGFKRAQAKQTATNAQQSAKQEADAQDASESPSADDSEKVTVVSSIDKTWTAEKWQGKIKTLLQDSATQLPDVQQAKRHLQFSEFLFSSKYGLSSAPKDLQPLLTFIKEWPLLPFVQAHFTRGKLDTKEGKPKYSNIVHGLLYKVITIRACLIDEQQTIAEQLLHKTKSVAGSTMTSEAGPSSESAQVAPSASTSALAKPETGKVAAPSGQPARRKIRSDRRGPAHLAPAVSMFELPSAATSTSGNATASPRSLRRTGSVGILAAKREDSELDAAHQQLLIRQDQNTQAITDAESLLHAIISMYQRQETCSVCSTDLTQAGRLDDYLVICLIANIRELLKRGIRAPDNMASFNNQVQGLLIPHLYRALANVDGELLCIEHVVALAVDVFNQKRLTGLGLLDPNKISAVKTLQAWELFLQVMVSIEGDITKDILEQVSSYYQALIAAGISASLLKQAFANAAKFLSIDSCTAYTTREYIVKNIQKLQTIGLTCFVQDCQQKLDNSAAELLNYMVNTILPVELVSSNVISVRRTERQALKDRFNDLLSIYTEHVSKVSDSERTPGFKQNRVKFFVLLFSQILRENKFPSKSLVTQLKPINSAEAVSDLESSPEYLFTDTELAEIISRLPIPGEALVELSREFEFFKTFGFVLASVDGKSTNADYGLGIHRVITDDGHVVFNGIEHVSLNDLALLFQLARLSNKVRQTEVDALIMPNLAENGPTQLGFSVIEPNSDKTSAAIQTAATDNTKRLEAAHAVSTKFALFTLTYNKHRPIPLRFSIIKSMLTKALDIDYSLGSASPLGDVDYSMITAITGYSADNDESTTKRILEERAGLYSKDQLNELLQLILRKIETLTHAVTDLDKVRECLTNLVLIAVYLVKLDADPNTTARHVTGTDKYENRLLEYAVSLNRPDLVEILLANGAKVAHYDAYGYPKSRMSAIAVLVNAFHAYTGRSADEDNKKAEILDMLIRSGVLLVNYRSLEQYKFLGTFLTYHLPAGAETKISPVGFPSSIENKMNTMAKFGESLMQDGRDATKDWFKKQLLAVFESDSDTANVLVEATLARKNRTALQYQRTHRSEFMSEKSAVDLTKAKRGNKKEEHDSIEEAAKDWYYTQLKKFIDALSELVVEVYQDKYNFIDSNIFTPTLLKHLAKIHQNGIRLDEHKHHNIPANLKLAMVFYRLAFESIKTESDDMAQITYSTVFEEIEATTTTDDGDIEVEDYSQSVPIKVSRPLSGTELAINDINLNIQKIALELLKVVSAHTSNLGTQTQIYLNVIEFTAPKDDATSSPHHIAQYQQIVGELLGKKTSSGLFSMLSSPSAEQTLLSQMHVSIPVLDELDRPPELEEEPGFYDIGKYARLSDDDDMHPHSSP